jgi:hypothetical protein
LTRATLPRYRCSTATTSQMAVGNRFSDDKQPALPASSPRARRNRFLTITAWLVVVGLVVFVAWTLPAAAAPKHKGPCTRHETGRGPPKPIGQFQSDSDPQFRLDFGASRELGTDFLPFVAYSGTPKNVKVESWRPITRGSAQPIDESAGLTLRAAVTRAAIGDNPAVVRVCIAIDPHQIPHLQPGLYQGKIVLSADNYRDERIPVFVTFRASVKRAIILAFVGVLIGLIARCLAELGSDQRSSNPGAWQALRAYLCQWGFPLAIILGVVTGYLGYVEIYDANPTWGVNGQDTLKLFGTCFGFQMGSIGGSDIVKRLVG